MVAYLLATTRWGSYVGAPSHGLYLSDVLLLGTLAWTLLRHRPQLDLSRRALVALAPVLALVGWAVLRFVAAGGGGFDALRDLAPYGYAVIATCTALVRTDGAARSRTVRVLVTALVVHLAWSAASTIDRTLSAGLPVLGNGVHVLELRPDADGAGLAVLAGVCAHWALTGQRGRAQRIACALVAAGCAGLVLQLANRAALLALVAATVSVVLADRRVWGQLPRRQVAGALLAVGLVGAAVVPSTGLYQRLSGDPEFADNAASATQQARVGAWRDVLAYVDDSPRAIAVGVGFGPDFVWNSGAALRLQGPGDVGVRAPHSFVLNTYARLGVVGLALLGWLVFAAARATRRPPGDELALTALLVSATLLVTSLVGVVLEAPFGALPFFWALGLLLGQSRGRPQVARNVGAMASGPVEGVGHDGVERVPRR